MPLIYAIGNLLQIGAKPPSAKNLYRYLVLAGEPDTRQIIHEFIHTNWNPRCSGTVQRSRFFDEGVTEYFTAKALACYGLQDVKASRALWEAQYRSAIEAHPEWKVPIADYGARGLGDLSYSYGPLALSKRRWITSPTWRRR